MKKVIALVAFLCITALPIHTVNTAETLPVIPASHVAETLPIIPSSHVAEIIPVVPEVDRV